MKRLNALLDAVSRRQAVPQWREHRTAVEAHYRALMDAIAADPGQQIYGLNTLSGHRDDHVLGPARARAFQHELIATHTISGAPFYSGKAALCIHGAKLFQIAALGPIISGPLYDGLIAAFEDPAFAPAIPRQSSYSCGDVIPAAHWARAVLSHLGREGEPLALEPGEGMALINGAFVHLGHAAHLADRVRALLPLIVDAMRADLRVARADAGALAHAARYVEGGYRAALDYLAEGADEVPAGAQLPVSYRAMPETLDLAFRTMGGFVGEIETQLARPSGNPLAIKGPEGIRPVSQASFMLPVLASATSSVIDALLFAGWAQVSRTKWLLSGSVDGIGTDGQAHADDIGFIQWPKLMQALLEDMRLRAGRMLYASGGETSYGVEDLWSSGVANLERLEEIVVLGERLFTLALVLDARLGQRFDRPSGLAPDVVAACIGDFAPVDAVEALRALYGGSHFARQRQWLF